MNSTKDWRRLSFFALVTNMSMRTSPREAPAREPRFRSGKLTPSDARAHNRSLVLQRLFLSEGMSRADLVRATGLTAATMSRIVADLIDDGFVEELTDRSPGSIGRPGVRVALDTAVHKVVAIDLSVNDQPMRGAVATLTGGLASYRELTDPSGSQEEFLERLAAFCDDLVRDAGVDVIGIGIAAPGVIDPDGTIVQAAARGWTDFPLAADLERRIGLPVHVGNDAYTSMQGEYTFGHADAQGSLFLTIGEGVGSGVLIDGTVVRGAEHAPGEIGHVRVVDDGALLCACGNRGCLETVVSAPALRRRMAEVAAEGGDPQQALRDAGRILGTALAPIVGALNLIDIVIGGPGDLVGDVFRDEILITIRERTLPALSDHLIVRSSSLGDDVALAGAAVLVVSGELGVS
jgi:predicted NBD/HSP70 family sugar kinase